MEEPDLNVETYYEIKDKLILPIEDFETKIWPRIDNIWAYAKRQPITKKRTQLTTYSCRLSKKYHLKKAAIPENAAMIDPTKKRKTSTRAPLPCHIKLKVQRDFKNRTVNLYSIGEHKKHNCDDCYKVKVPGIIKKFAKEEARKGYQPAAIKNVIKQSDLPGNLYITSQMVRNSKIAVMGDENNPFGHESTEIRDLASAIEYLSTNNDIFSFKTISDAEKEVVGIVWVHKKVKDSMEKAGSLVQMDTTFKTNFFEWRLLNVVFRDFCGVWLPGFHMLMKHENSATIRKGLEIAKELLPKWKPYYFIVDNSAIEQNAIRAAFTIVSGSNAMCTVKIFLCKFHLMQALRRNIKNTDVISKMIHAMNSYTRPGCEIRWKEAWNMANKEVKKSVPYRLLFNNVNRYLEVHWGMNDSHLWATWARNHSTLLLQCQTTNNVESYHSELKTSYHGSMTNKIGVSYGLKGALMAVKAYDESRFATAAKKAFEFRTKKVTLCETYKKLNLFPHPIQQLIVKEYQKAQAEFEEGNLIEMASPKCTCTFTQKYLLPCKHIFLQDLINGGDFISDKDWVNFLGDFEESGFEVYQTRVPVIVNTEDELQGPSNSHLKNFIETATNVFYSSRAQPNKSVLVDEGITQAVTNLQRIHSMTEEQIQEQFAMNNAASEVVPALGVSGPSRKRRRPQAKTTKTL